MRIYIYMRGKHLNQDTNIVREEIPSVRIELRRENLVQYEQLTDDVRNVKYLAYQEQRDQIVTNSVKVKTLSVSE